MQVSLRDCDIYNSNIRPYVHYNLSRRFPPQTVREIPIVASVNVAKKVVDSKASLYKNSPQRYVSQVDEDQSEAIMRVYSAGRVNTEMLWSNKYFELQGQNHIKIMPKDGKLEFRSLKNHQVNVVPSDKDPEKGEIYILSSFDKYLTELKRLDSDNYNEPLAEPDDYKAESMRFVVWSPSYHFVMDGQGNIIEKNGEIQIDNPIAPVIPIVEVSSPNKDFEYWIKGPSEMAEFTVDYNEHLSMLGQIVELQGFSQAFLKAPKNLQPQQLNVGPNRILRLVTDPDNPQADTQFGYASPSSDISSAKDYVESLLAQFLSSQGLDPSLITSNQQADTTFSSGVERLLAMIDRFEASKDTQDIYQEVEMNIFEVVKAWMNTLRDTDMLMDEFKTTEIQEDAKMKVEYNRPEAIVSPNEKLDLYERKIEMGIISRIDIIMETEGLNKEEAMQRAMDIDRENSMQGMSDNIPEEDNE